MTNDALAIAPISYQISLIRKIIYPGEQNPLPPQ